MQVWNEGLKFVCIIYKKKLLAMERKFKIQVEGEKTPVIRNLFIGKSKSGKEFPASLFLSQYGPRFYISNQEGYEREAASLVGVIKPDGTASTKKEDVKPGANFALWCDNEYVNKELFGMKVKVWLPVPGFDLETYSAACEALKAWEENRIQSEVESMDNNDTVTLVMTITGYGNAYHLKHEKLSWEASKTLEKDIAILDKAKAVKFAPDDWESSVYQAEIQYGEFLKLVSEIRAAKEAKEKAEKEATEAERKEAEENELFIFAKDVIYSSAGNKMLHSIGAVFGEKEIEVYNTRYASDMKRKGVRHTTTYDAKEELKALGFRWNPDEKNWKYTQVTGGISQEFAREVIAVIMKYDTKVWPGKLGMERCWECGTYFFPKRGDYDSGMPYCGC